MKPTVEQLVCFAILMENDRGILEKAPDYVMEKFWSCVTSTEPEALLDERNFWKFQEYMARWCKE